MHPVCIPHSSSQDFSAWHSVVKPRSWVRRELNGESFESQMTSLGWKMDEIQSKQNSPVYPGTTVMHWLVTLFQVVDEAQAQAFGVGVFQTILPGQIQCPKKQTRLELQAYWPGHVPLNMCRAMHRCPSQNWAAWQSHIFGPDDVGQLQPVVTPGQLRLTVVLHWKLNWHETAYVF